MFWNKRKPPKPNEAQMLLERARSLMENLMNSSYSMPSHIDRGIDNWLDDCSEADMEEYEKEPPK